jgi:DNA-binding response OmpR family regulator
MMLRSATSQLLFFIIPAGQRQGALLCFALGARDFVTKPIDFDEFVNMLRNTCKLVD